MMGFVPNALVIMFFLMTKRSVFMMTRFWGEIVKKASSFRNLSASCAKQVIISIPMGIVCLVFLKDVRFVRYMIPRLVVCADKVII
jgi:hypothetical protein